MNKLNSLRIKTYKKLDSRVSDITSHTDKILILLKNGSHIRLPHNALSEDEIQSLKRKHIKASSTEGFIVFSEFRNIDYFVSIQWMRYCEKWLPRELIFKPTYPKRIIRCVRVEKESLKNFTYKDVIQQAFPWDDTELYETFYVDVDQMSYFLRNDFYNLINDGPWPLEIAVEDSATFMYLEPIMPCAVILT